MKLKTLICAAAAFGACCSCTSGELSPVDYVDPFIGTGFHGHTYPGATVPFGAVQLSPDTRAGNWDACSGYHYNDTTLKGFSHTHLSGTGCIDLGDILFRPTTLKPDLTTESIYQPAAFSHKDEDASAGYYSVVLKEEGIKADCRQRNNRYAQNQGMDGQSVRLFCSPVLETFSGHRLYTE